MGKILYECKKCGKAFIINGNKDGLNCYKCKGTLMPLGYIDELQNSIGTMKDKIENADKRYMPNKKSKVKDLTIKINLDTTEFEKKLDRIEKKLEEINYLEVASRLSKIALKSVETALEFEESLNKVKNIVINNTYNNSK
ncbi:non-transporter ABC protein [Clostridium botulinum]|uniref:hypothetical protein n=1 Tax=Clostridium botulinum TaxID=1491 RepID=UPI000772E174|nr:hypothetical protein [Clostridium botulinum]AUN19056.1 non-transporter ABC protein [Clostridium botulinum]AUN23174.1 non-transporter ABC protein [Clostridium botulinum]OSA86434.1 non-transporter ABC protein [Clostridium botulinum]QDY26401.1 non-transporter ABC protein [Clostridium botulinum]